MIDHINLCELFIETHNEIFEKNKKYSNNCRPKKSVIQQRYLDLLNFVHKESYWTRFNLDINSGKYKEGCTSGKYLNEIHLILSNYKVYETLHTKLINKYLSITAYSTLGVVSQDSMFARSILFVDSNRNPQYYNKPGIKIHSITDSLRTPISIAFSNCTVHDSQTIAPLLDNICINKDIFFNHCHTFLADSAYNTDENILNITNNGLNVIFGRNKQHIKKGTVITNATVENKKTYKKRGIVENFFSNLARYPCILNVYEKTIESYKGLVFFVACVMLSKKINLLINEHNDNILKEQREMTNLKKKNDMIQRKKLREHRKIEHEKIKEEETKKRKELEKENIQKINIIIGKKIKCNTFNKEYNKRTKNNKALPYNTYEKKVNEHITNYIRNNVLMCTQSFIFANKPAYITIASKYAFAEDTIEKEIMVKYMKK